MPKGYGQKDEKKQGIHIMAKAECCLVTWLKCKLMISAKEEVLLKNVALSCVHVTAFQASKVLLRGMFLTLLLSPLLETWFTGTSTCILCQNDLGEQKKQGIYVMTKFK